MQIKMIFKNAVNAIKKHAGTIYAGAAVVGVGATVYLSGKAAVEVDHKIEPDMDIREKAKIYAHAYWLTILVSGATIGSIVMSDRTHVHGKAALAGALALANDRYKKLDSATREMIGDEATDDIYRKIAEDELNKGKDYLESDIGNKPLYFYEPVSGQCINTTYMRVIEALLESMFRLQKDMSVEFNVLLEGMDGIAVDHTANYYWDYDDDAQQYNASYSSGGFAIDFTDDVWEKIRYFTKPDVTMTPDDRITINYVLWPEERVPWD